MPAGHLESPFLQYLIHHDLGVGERLPTLQELSGELGVSVGKLREQLEVARGLGLVSVRPRLGIQREPFDFGTVVREGMMFALASGEGTFEQVSNMRQVLEIGLWEAAVEALTAEDIGRLRQLVASAWDKLRGEPVHIPTAEHRALHLTIFSKLNNPFVQGLLNSYWEAYEAYQLTRFTQYTYWIDAWNYHEQIVEALAAGEAMRGKQLLIEHFALLRPAVGGEK
ncbi:MAG: FCD domain-containing protein [Chloroflexi bacterium]|nr:FCD domain-containing protein [Chloroflexota bacterium]